MSLTGSWRAVFMVGGAPVLLALWIWRRVPESEMWQQRRIGFVR